MSTTYSESRLLMRYVGSMLFLVWLVFTAGCMTPEVECLRADDALDCGCQGPCPPGGLCIDGVCVGGDDPRACGPLRVVCPTGDRCVDGECVCDRGCACDGSCPCPPPELYTDAACGCPAVDCRWLPGRERCVEGQCQCDPASIVDDPLHCGCPGVRCAPGERCEAGRCVCDPANPEACAPGQSCLGGECRCDPRIDDNENCGCSGEPCPEGQVCRAGVCGCPDGFRACAEACIPAGATCCDGVEGTWCSAGARCERASPTEGCPSGLSAEAGESHCCVPVDHQTCHLPDGTFVGTCGDNTLCRSTTGLELCRPGEPVCSGREPCSSLHPRAECCRKGSQPCFSASGAYTHSCPSGSSCVPGGCGPADATECGERVCGRGFVCRTLPDGPGCIGSERVPCVRDGVTLATCEPGATCLVTEQGFLCMAPGLTACPNPLGLPRFCGAGERCEDGGRCVQLDALRCGSEGEACPAGSRCVDLEGTFRCLPQERIVCRLDDGEIRLCQTGERCDLDFGCVPPGSLPCGDRFCSEGEACARGGDWATCIAEGQSPCTDGTGALVGTCAAGQRCVTTVSGLRCIPAGQRPCLGVDQQLLGTCAVEERCIVDGEHFLCVAEGMHPCAVEGEEVSLCPMDRICDAQGVCLPPGWRMCPDGRTTCPPGRQCAGSSEGARCLRAGENLCRHGDRGVLSVCPIGAQCDAQVGCVGAEDWP